jgi:hypothetical protein
MGLVFPETISEHGCGVIKLIPGIQRRRDHAHYTWAKRVPTPHTRAGSVYAKWSNGSQWGGYSHKILGTGSAVVLSQYLRGATAQAALSLQ